MHETDGDRVERSYCSRKQKIESVFRRAEDNWYVPGNCGGGPRWGDCWVKSASMEMERQEVPSYSKALINGSNVARPEHEKSVKFNQSSEGSVSPPSQERQQASSEDTASKTIDFLRARLLAERATSKAAKDCAEQNAKKMGRSTSPVRQRSWAWIKVLKCELLELEKMLEIEFEKRMKAEAVMKEALEKLQVARLTTVSNRLDSEETKIEKQTTAGEGDQVKDIDSLTSTCIVSTQETELGNASLKNNILQEGENSSSNLVQSECSEQRKEGSSDLNGDNAKGEDYQQIMSFTGVQDQLPNSSKECKDNIIVSSSSSLEHQDEHSASTDHGKSLNQNKQCETEGNACQDSAAPEKPIGGNVTLNTRLRLEEKFGDLCDQMHKEVAALDGKNHKEFVRLKLHELMDQIVGTTEEELLKLENADSQASCHCLKLSALGCTCVQQNTNGNNSGGSAPQMEIPNKGLNAIDGLESAKTFDSNSRGDCRHQNERASTACIEMSGFNRQEKEIEHGMQCCCTNETLLQSSDCFDQFPCGKEDLCRDEVLEDRIHANFLEKQTPNMPSSLGNNNKDVKSNLHCRNLPEVWCDDCFKELHLKMRCLVGKKACHSKLYCNHEKAIQVKRGCNHNQAAMGLCRVPRSEGLLPRQDDLYSLQKTNYHKQTPDSRVYQRRDILPSRSFALEGGPSLLRNCYSCLPVESTQSATNVLEPYRNARSMKVYSDYSYVPLLSLQWGSRGMNLATEESPYSQMGKVGDALIALRHAKEQIRSTIKMTHHSNGYMGLTLSSHKGQFPTMQLASRQDATNEMGSFQFR
eukprot:Gb_11529 [translate_table: standard]